MGTSIIYLDKSISSSVHASAFCADCFTEGDFVVVYSSNICCHVRSSLVTRIPTQNAASLISEGILYFCLKMWILFKYSNVSNVQLLALFHQNILLFFSNSLAEHYIIVCVKLYFIHS